MSDPVRRRRRPAQARDADRRWVPRAPIILVVAVAVIAAVVLDRTGDHDTAAARPSTDAPSIPSADALSAAWYCPEGTAAEDERADETVLIANVGDDDAQAIVTVYDSGEGEPAQETVDIPAGEQRDVDVTDITDEPEVLLFTRTLVGPGVVVEAFGGQVVVEHALRSGDDLAVGPCARGAAPEWFFATGTTVRGTELMLSLFNPFADDAIVDLTFLTDTGVQSPEGAEALTVPRQTRLTIPVHELVQRQAEVATVVRARTGRLVAEQLLVSDGSEVAEGLAVSLGVTEPADTWTFPYGLMAAGGAHAVSVANFADRSTEVEVSVVSGGGGRDSGGDSEEENGVDEDGDDNGEEDAGVIAPQTIPLGPRSVSVVDVGALATVGAAYAVDVRVTGDEPVVAEELVTFGGDTTAGLALDVGGSEPARRWAFAGSDDPDVGVTIELFNPDTEQATASLLTFASGQLSAAGRAPDVSIAPGERASFELAELDIEADQILIVQADRPVFAERVLFVDAGSSLGAGIPDR